MAVLGNAELGRKDTGPAYPATEEKLETPNYRNPNPPPGWMGTWTYPAENKIDNKPDCVNASKAVSDTSGP
ncbi:MAG TPA: hypothetical protein ENN39_05595 [Desulfonatronum sp.]|nr:hypothetical protein [Desulfonatronum sp.]